MLQTLDVALGLALIFFLFSVLVSTISEIFLTMLNARGKMLWEALSHLLPQNGHGADAAPLNDFVQHPLMMAMHRSKKVDASVAADFPSYLSNSQFSQVLVDLLEVKGGAKEDGTRWDQVRAGIAKMDAGARGSLEALRRDAERQLMPGQNPLTVFQFLTEKWFDGMMDRTSGWYKRLTQVWNFGLGLVLAVACNLNIIALTRALSTNDELRSALVQKAEAAVQNGAAAAKGTARDEMAQVAKDFGDAGFPIGWNEKTAATWQWKTFLPTLSESLLGWLMAAAAAMLGAQFWFDLMKRIVNLRGTGVRPESPPELPVPAAGTGISPS